MESAIHLSEKDIKEFQEIYKKEYGKEISYQEAAASAHALLGFTKVLYDSSVREMQLKEKLEKFPKGFPMDDDAIYNCGICHADIKGAEAWYDKWGKKCLACQDAVNKRKIPGRICYNDELWYATWEFDVLFNLKAPTVRKLVRNGVLKARVVPKSGFEVFLIKDNADTLPPKELVKAVPTQSKKNEKMISILQWYEYKDPEETLKGYRIWPYLTVFHKNSGKRRDSGK